MLFCVILYFRAGSHYRVRSCNVDRWTVLPPVAGTDGWKLDTYQRWSVAKQANLSPTSSGGVPVYITMYSVTSLLIASAFVFSSYGQAFPVLLHKESGCARYATNRTGATDTLQQMYICALWRPLGFYSHFSLTAVWFLLAGSATWWKSGSGSLAYVSLLVFLVSVIQWLLHAAVPQSLIMVLLMCMFAAAWQSLEQKLKSGGHALVPVPDNLVDLVWGDKPAPPCHEVFPLPVSLTGTVLFGAYSIELVRLELSSPA